MVALAGQKVTASLLNSLAPTGETTSGVNTTAGTTTSTGYTDTLTSSSTVSVAFIAPPSGKIAVTICGAVDNGGDNYSVISYRLSGAAGTVAASDNWQVYFRNTNEGVVSRTTYQTGLTPGAAGTITMQHKVSGGTGTFNHREILWRPVAA
ncbi:hypothetical protein [Lentzea sp. NPDC092896]|uniref:hypothetical protein n=1 Tax=Lentzea sp. NPDC092896 TaxID=3364127 RepID=UPI0037FFBBB2